MSKTGKSIELENRLVGKGVGSGENLLLIVHHLYLLDGDYVQILSIQIINTIFE